MKTETFPAHYPRFIYEGRTFEDNSGFRALSGPGSSLKFRFKGNACKVWMATVSPEGWYNYISFVVDGKHYQRIPIEHIELSPVNIPIESDTELHDVEIYKETESSCGYILISTVDIDGEGVAELPFGNKSKLEFIGNSITAGMSADPVFTNCGEGPWFSHSNAYDAFGPIVARRLNCTYMLSAVSGMGMYRNWNSDSPVMKDVYSSVELIADPKSPRLNYDEYHPDIIAICVGANDLSDGDGNTPRMPFDSTKFMESYISFVKNLHDHHPQAKYLLMNGPVNSPEKDEMFKACLTSLKPKLESAFKVNVGLHFFPLMNPEGCDGHPDLAQQKEMALGLEPVLKAMLEM